MTNTVYLKDYKPADFKIAEVMLDIKLDPKTTTVDAHFQVERTNKGTADLFLHGDSLDLVSITLNEEPCDYRLAPEGIYIKDIKDKAQIHTRGHIHPEKNTALSGLYYSNGTLCTQCEPEGFRHITWFLDRPDCMSRYTVRLEADRTQFPVLLAGGNQIDQGTLDGGKHFVVWQDPFYKPSYLFAIVAGNLEKISDQFTTMSGRTVSLNVYSDKEQLAQCQFALDALKRAMEFDENAYGREYDLDDYKIVAIGDFNSGAMENKGLNIFNFNCILADDHTATDDDFARVEAVIAHEYFHNWSGNRVTLRDWFQLSLKEGLTVFREQKYCESVFCEGVERIAQINVLRSYQFIEDQGPTAHPVQPDSYQKINNFYTTTVYEKGAELIRQMQRLIGTEKTHQGLDLYFSRHDGQAVTIEHLIKAFEDASGANLQQYIHWYKVAGTPTVTIKRRADQDGTLVLDIEQKSKNGPLHIALALAVFDKDGHNLKLELNDGLNQIVDGIYESVYPLRKKKTSLRLENIKAEPGTLISALRGFSAPVILNHDLKEDEQLKLLGYEKDVFILWEIARSFMVRSMTQSDKPDLPTLIRLFSTLIDQAPSFENALLGELLTLPSYTYLLQSIDQVDPIMLQENRKQAQKEIGLRFNEFWQNLYNTHIKARTVGFNHKRAEQRRLSNLALQYLHCANQDLSLALSHLDYGGSMSNQLSALFCLREHTQDQARQRLFEFPTQFTHAPVLIQSWFRLLASSEHYGHIEGIKKLVSNPLFKADNPNYLSCVYGGFGQNIAHFHNLDGSGYAFFADAVIEIDQSNPQIAAHIIRPLLQWRKFISPYKDNMRNEIERINCGNPSANLKEMLSRALEQKDKT